MTREDYIKESKRFFSKRSGMDYVFLFGSALRHMHKDSDIDFLVQGRVSVKDHLKLTADLEQILGRRTDIVLVPQASCELFLDALSEGCPVLIRNPKRLKEDYFRNLHQYDDTEPLRRLIQSRLKERFGNG